MAPQNVVDEGVGANDEGEVMLDGEEQNGAKAMDNAMEDQLVPN